MDKLIRALQQAGELAPPALASSMVREMEHVITNAKEKVPVDMGTLRASGTVLTPTISGAQVTVVGGFGGAAGKYAIWVHEGRKPNSKMPPLDPIRTWLRRHGIDEKYAFVVARNIAKRGIPKNGIPSKYLEHAFMERIPGMAERMAAGVAEAWARMR